MPQQRIHSLFARKLAGEASPEELQEIADYLRTHPEEQYFQEIFSNWWESGVTAVKKTEASDEDRVNRILRQSGHENEPLAAVESVPERRIFKWAAWQSWAAAAVLAGVLLIAYKAFYVPGPAANTADNDNEIVAKRGTKSRLLLPDGTQVWLNSDSRLIYNTAFNDSLREVKLEGEAYFDVVKDPARPFIVHTSGINIRVLGTAFNVKSYPQDPTIEATLVRGLIEVEKNNQPQSSRIILKPNEKLIYNKKPETVLGANPVAAEKNKEPFRELLKPETISISALRRNVSDSIRVETSWVYGKLVFEGESFHDLALRMERWFNVKISFRNEKVAAYRFTGAFENENISEALHALQLTASFTSTVNGNEVWIDKK